MAVGGRPVEGELVAAVEIDVVVYERRGAGDVVGRDRATLREGWPRCCLRCGRRA
jgi:hypothetical protein